MFRNIFIFILIGTICISMPARAETVCQMIDKVLGTVSLVRNIQVDPSEQNYSANLSKLGSLVDQISLPLLFPPESRNELSLESEIFFHYISNVRQAVSAADLGIDGYFKQALSNELTHEFFNSVLSVEHFWKCREEGSEFQSEINASPESLAYFEELNTSINNVPDTPAGLVVLNSKVHNPSAGRGTSEQDNFKFTAIYTRGKPQIILIILFIGIAGFIYAPKYLKKLKIREKRKFITKSVAVFIEGKNLTMTIVDISMNGCKISHQEVINNQHQLSIQLDGGWYAGHIKWSNEHFAGIKFKKPISEQTLSSVVLN